MKISRAVNLDQAVDVWLRRGDEIKKRLFDPRSGSDLGESVPTGYLARCRSCSICTTICSPEQPAGK